MRDASACAGAAFAADDNPIDFREVDFSEVLEEWFDRKKTHCGRRHSEVINSWDSVSFVLDAHSPPDMRLTQQMTIWLRGDLAGVPIAW